MIHEEYASLLEHHGIRPTANRILVAGCIAGAGRPLSQSEVERQLLTVDKSVVSRTLALFRDHHLVHVIDDGVGGARYELCHSHSYGADDDLHVHFVCEHCERTFCLEAIPIPPVVLPPGFEASSANFIVKGLCPQCLRN